ncbi:MAG: hypothetical protein DWQ10_17540 [Calditrichaeota bacterium]|nr:MAG: hypothetical protein DWQ10_17540 [Calditrichota bacterium]
MKEKDWLAEVASPIQGKKTCSISTGVPISRRLLLTSGHGVPKEIGQKVKIRFIRDFQEKKDWREATVIWHGKEKHKIDAALLKFETIKELESYIYTGLQPINPVDWYGAGFAAAVKITEGELKGHRDTAGLNGKYNPMGCAKTDLLNLTVLSKPVKPELWAGVSGAPVLFSGRLIGIVRSLNENFGGDSLDAIPIKELLEIDEFRDLIGCVDRLDSLNVLRQNFIEEIGKSKEAIDILWPLCMGTDKMKTPESIIDILLHKDILSFVNIMNNALKNLDLKLSEPRRILLNLLEKMLPMLYDKAFILSVRSVLDGKNIPNYAYIPIRTPTIAEIIMAAIDRRKVDFKWTNDGRSPVGRKNIAHHFREKGFDITGDCGLDELIDLLSHDPQIVDPDDLKREKKDTIIELINLGLERLFKDKKENALRYYFIVNKDLGVNETVISRIKNELPKLTLIELSDSAKLLVEEREITLALRDAYFPRKD